MGPLTFTGLRFFLGWLVLQPLLRLPQLRSSHPAPPLAVVIGLGVLLFSGAWCQQIGLQTTTASKAGFLTGMYVVLVPIIGIAFGKRTHLATWIGVMFTAFGLYFLSVTDDLTLAPGDGWILLGAVIWSLHVLGLGHYASRCNPLKLAANQFLVVGVLGSLAAVPMESFDTDAAMQVLPWLLYSGIFAVAGAFTLQAFGQAIAPPAHAAILLSFEAVFATGAGWMLLGEQLSARELQGCALMMVGILASQIRRPTKKDRASASASGSP